ncbi:MAG: SNF2 helicase associated domain-containing protein [Lachnospiraceae bacterium]|nr:SNF2 helicase associated domain-containing protein [Lachnospiraceae bacterium]
MLTLEDIKGFTFSKNYKKGLELQRLNSVKEFEYSIYSVNESTIAELQAKVKEASDICRNCLVIVDEEYADISEYRCDCEEVLRDQGMCQHCIAVVVEYLMKRRVKEVLDVKWNKELNIQRGFHQQTSQGMKSILNRYAKQGTSKYLLSETDRGNVQLIPYVTENGNKSISIDFKIGIEQKYVVKNLSEFLDAIEYAKKVTYGKKLEFYHTMEAFTENSQRLITFLKEKRKEYSKKTVLSMYFYRNMGISYSFERTIQLDEAGMEQFFEVMQGEYFEGTFRKPVKEFGLGLNYEYLDTTVWYVSTEEKKPKLTIIGDANGAMVELEEIHTLYGADRYFFCEQGTIYKSPAEFKEKAEEFYEYLSNEEFCRCYIAAGELPVFCRELLPQLKEMFDTSFQQFDERLYLPQKPEFELYVDKLEHNVVAGKVMVIYPEKQYNLLDKIDFTTLRNVEEETRISRMVRSYFHGIDASGSLFVIGEDEDLLYQLLSGGLQRLSEHMTIYASDAFQRMKIHSSPNVSVGLSLKSDLLELQIQSEELPLDQLAYLLSKYDRKKRYIRLKNGDFMNLNRDDGLEILAELKEDLHFTDAKLKTGNLIIPKYRAMYLDSSLRDKQSLRIEKNKEFKSMIRNMKTIEDSDYEVPVTLKKIMRAYQKIGYRWMKTLREYGFGGILADDMGLGKTLQVISLILSEWLEQQEGTREKKPFLVICPASLVYNWKKEMERFAPELSIKIISGNAAERKEEIGKIAAGEVVITSYDLLKRDVKNYEDHIFAIQVIDEAQYIKNPTTQAAKAVKKISAGFKLALTGTPIENRLSELWSIFDYLMPGFLYPYARFRDEMEMPIVVGKDENKMERLQRMIRPFVLRRLKTDVLKDLPEKLEENIYSKIEGEQLALYDAHVQRMKIMLDKKTEQEFRSGRFEILAELTKLRQLCCDPSLVFEDYKGESAKMETCMELITNAVNGGHKILLFSQFTTMLEHLQERLEAVGVSYYTLTGAVNKEKRMQLVEDFNKDDTNVFCISLKAGGTGLNLTAADIVIHYDPWWNVAVQNQATDRAHRIGQENVVTVYKLVTQGTIEEKIVEMQEKKKALADEVLEGVGMDTSVFSREELLELLG